MIALWICACTVSGADDAPDTHCSLLRHFEFRNLRHVGLEDVLEGDAAADPFRQRPACKVDRLIH